MPSETVSEYVTPELLAATSALQDITFRANELGIGLAKYPVGEIEAVLQFVSLAISALLPKATAPVVSESEEQDGRVEIIEQCDTMDGGTALTLRQYDQEAVAIVHFSPSQPQPKAVTEDAEAMFNLQQAILQSHTLADLNSLRKTVEAIQASEAAMKEA